MSLEAKIVKGVSWMAVFTSVSQTASWLATIVIARVLVPADYGLMAMSTVFTGYALVLSELGLGHAIIQRPTVSSGELSSIFWFVMGISALLGVSCLPVSFLTAYVMHEQRVVPLTQAVALVFVLSGLQVVPGSLLRREMDFRAIAGVEMIGTLVASASMLAMAVLGFGVWTLLLGTVALAGTKSALLFMRSKWRPRLHFSWRECSGFMSFGLTVAANRSLFYIQEVCDVFFAGRAWTSGLLGYYSFALQLARTPTNKIVVLINNVSFPALARLQGSPREFARMYLHISKVTVIVTLPLFLAGFILGDDLITVILGDKWTSMVFLFQALCLAQILSSVNAINGFLHAALGRPHWATFYNLSSLLLMSASFALAARYGLNAMAVPWLSTYVVLCCLWQVISLRSIGVSLSDYLLNLKKPLMASSLVSLCLLLLHYGLPVDAAVRAERIARLAVSLVSAASLYACYFYLFDRPYLISVRKLLRSR